MYSDFAKREKTPQEILLEEALKDAQDIPQAHTDWWKTATIEDVKAKMAKGADVNTKVILVGLL